MNEDAALSVLITAGTDAPPRSYDDDNLALVDLIFSEAAVLALLFQLGIGQAIWRLTGRTSVSTDKADEHAT
jgi:hypothetical protein